MPEIVLIAHNIRSSHNVGSLFRTAEGLGIKRLILSGYTPYPKLADDSRLPHISRRQTDQIHKTALGTEALVPFTHQESLDLAGLKSEGYDIVALEQSPRAIMLDDFQPPAKLALLLGEEVAGISQQLLDQADQVVEIPMVGQKESFNVSVAAAIALYQLSRK